MFLLALSVAAPTFAVELTLGGFTSYMRTRARVITGATFISALSNDNAIELGFNDNDDNIFFVDTTLRLTPQLVLSDSVTIRAQIGVFDNNIWGGTTTGFVGGGNTVINSSISFSDRFRGALLTGARAIDDPGFFDIRMLHVDIVLPNNLGFIRVGRQPFDWGLGILANGGWDPQSDLGFVLDRFLWLKSWGVGDGTFTFVFVTDRFTQGNSVVAGTGDAWDGGAVALILNQPNAMGGNLTLGGYLFPYIHQTNLGSTPVSGVGGVPTTVSGIDLEYLTLYAAFIDYKTDGFRLIAEMQGAFGNLNIQGTGSSGGTDIGFDASNILFAARAEVYPGWPFKIVAVEFGYAKGDDADTLDIEGGAIFFNPAFNIDSLLFKHMIPNLYQVESSVFNAYYARLYGTVKLSDSLTFSPQVLIAFNEETSDPSAAILGGNTFEGEFDTYMATEVEGTLTWNIHPGVSLDLIGGVVFTGDSLEEMLEQQAVIELAAAEVTSDGVSYDETPWTVQGRLTIYIDQFFK
jgi:hypothetical protein